MDKTVKYRQLIKQLLHRYIELINNRPVVDVRSELVVDEERDHYMIVTNGWSGDKRIRGTTLYIRLMNGKFWIEEDWLEQGIVTDLLDAGIPHDDIVLAFHHPDMRPLTDFAVA